MSGPVLDISHASRAFADRQALHDVSLQVTPSEIVALLGPNGAGKTSLMRAIAGRLRLDSGRVAVAGLDPHNNAAARATLGIVPQSLALYPQLTARQNLAVFARLAGLAGKHAKVAVEAALLRAGLQDRADERLSALSGGMQRRINIVAGTLHQPQLLLLDEPTVGVDLYAREAIHDLLRTLRDAGMGILFSTHDFDQAAEVADRAAFMIAGRLVLQGPVAELVRNACGDAKEVIVMLTQAPGTAARQILVNWHLTASEDDHEWHGALTGAYATLAKLEAELEHAGAHVSEIRVREPGLGTVFMRLMESHAA
jgi:ABC-2 type transport system ATP-binding protein